MSCLSQSRWSKIVSQRFLLHISSKAQISGHDYVLLYHIVMDMKYVKSVQLSFVQFQCKHHISWWKIYNKIHCTKFLLTNLHKQFSWLLSTFLPLAPQEGFFKLTEMHPEHSDSCNYYRIILELIRKHTVALPSSWIFQWQVLTLNVKNDIVTVCIFIVNS